MILSVISFMVAGCTKEVKKRNINFVIIHVDDMGWTDLSCFGRDLFWHFPHYRYDDVGPYSIIFSGRHKLIHYFDMQDDELYDLAHDPREGRNIVNDNSALQLSLRTKLQKWYTFTNTRLPERK